MKDRNLKNSLVLILLLYTGMTIAQGEQEMLPPSPVIPESEVVTPEIVELPDEEAQFPEGAIALQRFIQENVQYPIEALELGIQGRVYVSFVVEGDGSISNIEIMRGASEVLDKEALRLIQIMPKWIPAKDRGGVVRSRCRLPISFTLVEDSKTEKSEDKPTKNR